jgi:hypothetical protein
MRLCWSGAILVASLIVLQPQSCAQNAPKVHDISGFMVQGVFNQLDPEVMKHRLTLREIDKANLSADSTNINDIVAWMANCEKLHAQVEEPLEVRGQMPVFLPPNTMGDEAYTACFYAFNCNGLGLSGVSDNLVVVRPEKHPRLAHPLGTWNPDKILPTQLFRLGYLKPDRILRHYRDKVGTSAGHAILEPKSNVVIVTDTRNALDSLLAHIDSEVLEAMGVPAAEVRAPADRRPPSPGAIASKEAIHFYLMTFARTNQFPLAAARMAGTLTRHYPEADLWTSESSYAALASEYQRINAFAQVARETGGPGWDEANLQRALLPASQRRMSIRFGLARAAAASGGAQKGKKGARKR